MMRASFSYISIITWIVFLTFVLNQNKTIAQSMSLCDSLYPEPGMFVPYFSAEEQNLCPGETTLLTYLDPSDLNEPDFQWEVFGDRGEIIGSTDSYTIEVTAGRYKFSGTTIEGCGFQGITAVGSPQNQVIWNETLEHCLGETYQTAQTLNGTVVGDWTYIDGPDLADISNDSFYTTNFDFNTTGTYTYTFSQAGCTSYVTVFFEVSELVPEFELTASNEFLCFGETVELNVSITDLDPFHEILWSTGESGIDQITVQEAGVYSVVVSNACGSYSQDIDLGCLYAPDPNNNAALSLVSDINIPQMPHFAPKNQWILFESAHNEWEWRDMIYPCNKGNELQSFQLYPNPSSGCFNVKGQHVLKVVTTDGRSMDFERNGASICIKKKGLYVIIAENGKAQLVVVE